MAETPINLNRARKAREKAGRKAAADANSVRFGRTKAERAQADAEQALRRRQLDGHRTGEE